MISYSRRRVLAVLVVAAMGITSPRAFARSATFPSRPITLIVPFPAGGVVDVVARLVGQEMSGGLKVPVVVEARPGAGGTIGAGIVAKARPDGYTLLVGGAATQILAPALYRRVPYDPLRSFAPIGGISKGSLVVTVGSKIQSQNLAGTIKELKAAGDHAVYCNNGPGTFPQLAGEMFKADIGLTMSNVAYSGGPACAVALLNGEAWISINHIPVVQGLIKAGKLRPLATTGSTRSPAFPNVPTLQELGMKNFEASAWWGLFAPARTPQTVIEKVNLALGAALKDPKVKAQLARQGDEPSFSTPQRFSSYVRDETAKWTKVVKAAHLSID